MVLNEIIERLQPLSSLLDGIQSILCLKFLEDRFPDAFESPQSLARVGFLGSVLGIVLGIHVTLLCLILFVLATNSSDGADMDHTSNMIISSLSGTELNQLLIMLFTWCVYVSALCTFHLSEFFVTALYNVDVLSSDSYLVNHSKAYTGAAIIASAEFWTRFVWCCWRFLSSTTSPIQTFSMSAPSSTSTLSSSSWWWTVATIVLGVALVTLSQIVRTWSMKTCGESFNHYIQVQKKDNHVLVTTGIYQWLRHPSYFGFYYWSVGTQVVLQNPISLILFVLAGWTFFSRRIPYEERSLIHLFGDEYYNYAKRTYVGIPFIPTRGLDEPPDEDTSSSSAKHSDCGTSTGHEVQLDDIKIGHAKAN
jgi:protein-S-isoprenylcysteine O-methyltransferase